MPRAGKKTSSGKKTLAESDVAGVFGIELAEPETSDAAPSSTEKPAKPRRRVDRGTETRGAQAAQGRESDKGWKSGAAEDYQRLTSIAVSSIRQSRQGKLRGLDGSVRRTAGNDLPVAEVARLRVGRPIPKSGDFGYGNLEPTARLKPVAARFQRAVSRQN